ncbi:hypothetical protein [Reyranella sp.]|uniref:hypothetical protein n=1 Tax=Reyranella sp. TaxID=1929291 RepID=UPI003D149D20
MFLSPPALHPPLITTDQDNDLVRSKIAALTAGQPKRAGRPIAAGASFSIALTTLSKSGNFDSYIDVQFPNQSGNPITASLLVDSGNNNMIIPNGDELVGVPGYTILGTALSPFTSCPANVVQGPLQIVATDGGVYQIDNCVFYACTPKSKKDTPESNFGMGRIHPWGSSHPWNKPLPNVVLQSPLSYGTDYRYAEIIFEEAATMLSSTADILVRRGSRLVMHTALPPGYTLLSTIPHKAWMSVVPTSFGIGGTPTGWPGTVSPLIAMIDTGGGPVILSDPDGYVWPKTWPDPVACPSWTGSSKNCNCISDPLQISLAAASGSGTYAYTIDTSALPPQRLTAVACEKAFYLEGEQGMNVGGITFLFNRLLIDYAGTRIGLAPKMS